MLWRSPIVSPDPSGIVSSILSTGTDSPGAEIYHGSCSVCHGDDGKGAHWAGSGLKPPPRDFTTEEARTSLSRERMRSAILDGRPGTAMTSFSRQLSSAQADAVIDYIQQAFMEMAQPQ